MGGLSHALDTDVEVQITRSGGFSLAAALEKAGFVAQALQVLQIDGA
jgi:hypothetical protein